MPVTVSALIIHDHCSMLVQDLLLADRVSDKATASNRILMTINDEAADGDSARLVQCFLST